MDQTVPLVTNWLLYWSSSMRVSAMAGRLLFPKCCSRAVNSEPGAWGLGSLPSAWGGTQLAILEGQEITAKDGLVSARQVRHYRAMKIRLAWLIKPCSLHWILIKAFAELRVRGCSGCSGLRSAQRAVTYCRVLTLFGQSPWQMSSMAHNGGWSHTGCGAKIHGVWL